MSEVVVTRADREAWHQARYGYVPEDGHPSRSWCTSGSDPHDTQANIAIMNNGALAIARARAEGFEAGRVAERRDVVAWHRDRDRKRSAEDVFFDAYNGTRKGMGLAEAIYRGTLAVAKAMELAEHVGAADELDARKAAEHVGAAEKP